MLLVVTGFAVAVGVSQPYWVGNPLKISPGETEVVELTLQNMVGDQDVTLRAILVDGAGIASLPSQADYVVGIGTSDTKVPVTITIPETASIGDTNIVKLSFRTVTPGEADGVSLGLGYEIEFDVLVVEATPEAPSAEIPAPTSVGGLSLGWIIGIVALVIIVVLIIIFVMKGKKEETSIN